MADDGLTSVWVLFLIWVVISIISYSPPPAPKKKEGVLLSELSENSVDDSFLDTIMWLNQND